VVESVSAALFLDGAGRPYHHVRIRANRGPAGHFLLPGMAVRTDILAGEQTLLHALLDPAGRR
jgi:multidrug efflux pump subunit AcrA (membrane-fusion protein)